MIEAQLNKITINKMSAFPKIFHIGENYIINLFDGEVEITEKIDGSQWCFGMSEDGELVCRSKGQDLTYRDVPKMFELAYQTIKRKENILQLHKDTYFFCEFLNKPKHNTLNYSRVPKNNLYLFGVMEGRNFIKQAHKLYEYADLLDIERPNILYFGKIKELKELEKLLEIDSVLGNEKVEGIVVKNYNQPAIITANYILPMSMGKYVREDYKERHGTEWKSTMTNKGKLENFVSSFRTEARWQKAVQHLREKDELENAPRDIGKLMVEIERDLLEEETENIKSGLLKMFKDSITRKARAGFPEWYKNKLMEGVFKNEEIK